MAHPPFIAWVLVLTALAVLGSPAVVHAAGPEDIFRSGNSIVVPSGEVLPHDLFAVADSVAINGTVQGDVVAGGRAVVINGTIEGDLWAAANLVQVNGRVQGDVRAGSGTLLVAGNIGRHVLAFADDVEVASGGRVGGDVITFSSRLLVAGEVGGDVAGEVGEHQITGSVRGQDRLKVRPPEEEERPLSITQWLAGRVRHWAGVVLLGGLVALGWRNGFLAQANTVARRPLASLGSGVLVVGGSIAAMVITFILLILLAIVLGVLGLGGLTVVAVTSWLLAVAALILGLGVGATFLAGAVAGLVLGRRGLEGRWPKGRLAFWGWLATGTLVYVLIAGAPWIGGLVQLVVALLALGAVGLALWAKRRRLGASPAA